MKNKITLSCAIVAIAIGVAACGGKAPAPSATTAPKPTTDLKASQKPDGGNAKGIPAAKKIPVPNNWIYIYDDVKGYGFYVPEGTKGDSSSEGGMNVFVATTAAPAEVGMTVMAYKDKTLTKADLLDFAVKFLEEMGETVQAGALSDEGPDFALADATSVDSDGKKSKMRILVGTDVTDNYVMIVGAEESKFEANKEIIDAIWGSFEMWSL